MLGYFSKYAVSGIADVKHPSRDQVFFERIRDKYNMIVDLDNNLAFTRRRAFFPWVNLGI